MGLTVEDLKPKSKKIKVKGVELTRKPVRMRHALAIARLSDVFTNPANYSEQQTEEAEAELERIIGKVVPELEGVELDASTTMEVIEAIMSDIEPSDNRNSKITMLS